VKGRLHIRVWPRKFSTVVLLLQMTDVPIIDQPRNLAPGGATTLPVHEHPYILLAVTSLRLKTTAPDERGFSPNAVIAGISWVIVGGESGPGACPMKREGVVSIRSSAATESAKSLWFNLQPNPPQGSEVVVSSASHCGLQNRVLLSHSENGLAYGGASRGGDRYFSGCSGCRNDEGHLRIGVHCE
jgi:hypothetical protein